MKLSKSYLFSLLLILPGLNSLSAQQSSSSGVSGSDVRQLANEAAAELDKIERDLEEWGHGSMSGLVLFPNNGEFDIKNSKDVGSYLKTLDTHTAGGVAVTFQKQTGVQAQGAVDTGLDSGAPGADSDPGAGTLLRNQPAITTPKKGDQNPGQGNKPEVTTNKLPPSVIDKIAASSFVSKTVLNKFSNPEGAASNYVMFMGLAQVSVSPGWRTQKDYFCEIQMRPVYAKRGGDGRVYSSLEVNRLGQPYESGTVGGIEQPSVFSAFPLLDAQVLDQSFTEDRQADILLEFAGQAFAAGEKASGRFLLEQHRKMTQNVKTRSALPLLVPSSDGMQLTYRFDPALHAVEEPGVLKSKPANLLKANSVPTLFVLACQKSELEYWSHVNITVSTRFIPAKKRHLLNQAIDVPRFTYIRGIPYSNKDRLEMARRVSKVHSALEQSWQPGYPTTLAAELQSRYINLLTLSGGEDLSHELPLPQPSITGVSPNTTIPIQAGQPISITGTGFFRHDDLDDSFIDLVSLNGVALRREFAQAAMAPAQTAEFNRTRGDERIAKAVTATTSLSPMAAILGANRVSAQKPGSRPFELRYFLPPEAEELFVPGPAKLTIMTKGGTQTFEKRFTLTRVNREVNLAKVVPSFLPVDETEGCTVLLEGKFGAGKVHAVLVNGRDVPVEQSGPNHVVAQIDHQLAEGKNPIVVITSSGATSLDPGIMVGDPANRPPPTAASAAAPESSESAGQPNEEGESAESEGAATPSEDAEPAPES